jgi:hypothetical protein
MALAQWLKVLDAIGGLAQLTGRLRRPPEADEVPRGLVGTGGPLGQLETRLAGVVVAALKEAFDRDRARMDLERSALDAERQRAEEALRAELRRQAGERAVAQLRVVALMAIGVWMLSAALGVWLPGIRAGIPMWLLGGGWFLAIGALGCSFAAWQHVSAWSSDPAGGPAPAPRHPAAAAAPWLLLSALAFTSAALLGAFINGLRLANS